MNAKQLSEYLRIHVHTARLMMASGKIKATKTVKGWDATQQDVNDFLKKHE